MGHLVLQPTWTGTTAMAIEPCVWQEVFCEVVVFCLYTTGDGNNQQVRRQIAIELLHI